MNVMEHLRECTEALANPAGPPALYQAIQDALGTLVGHRLFTLLIVTPDGQEVERIWTSNPTAYPVQGRKRMGPTPWGEHVLKGQETWMCNDVDGIRWAFPDHALIESLGLGSCINVPVVAFGRTLGTLNLLDQPGMYDVGAVKTAGLFAAFLVFPFHIAA